MPHFDLAQLHCFLKVCETGSISAAAPLLFRSTSAISEQLRKLEQEVGVSLLVRGKLGVRTTPAGERLRGHAERLLMLNEQALADIRGQTFEGEIRLAITDYFRPDAIAGLLRRLRERYPRLRLHVTLRKSLTIEQSADDFDIGLAMRFSEHFTPPEPFEIRRESFRWVGATDLALELNRPLPLLALTGCALLNYSCQMLEKAGIGYEIVYSTSGVAGLQSALRAGLGVACLNDGAVPEGVVPLTQALPPLAQARFVLLPPRPTEGLLVTQVRDLLMTHLA